MTLIYKQAKDRLRETFKQQRPDIDIDSKGYVKCFRHNLLPLVEPTDFELDLIEGNGNELQSKFCAAHSSSALAVNCFAPFRRRMEDFKLPNDDTSYKELRFEAKCPIGIRGIPPHLDVLVSDENNNVVGIESKLTEYLGKKCSAEFRPAYDNIDDERRNQGYFEEMLHLKKYPNSYTMLNAAQLIKHAFGLYNTYHNDGKSLTLFYLYWESSNADDITELETHRKEIADFKQRIEAVKGTTPQFIAMSYKELWDSWCNPHTPEWLNKHLDQLTSRYLIEI